MTTAALADPVMDPMVADIAHSPLTSSDLPKREDRRCDACELYLSPRIWQSLQRERLPYVFECETCCRPILSPDTYSDDPEKIAAMEEYSKHHCDCRCICEEFNMVPPRPWHIVDSAWNVPIFRKFEPNCTACVVKPRIEGYLQGKGFCQRDLYLEWLMREQRRLRQLEVPPTREEVEAADIHDPEPTDQYFPPSSTLLAVPIALLRWGLYPNGEKISKETFSGLPPEVEDPLLEHDPEAFGIANSCPDHMMFEEREFHTPEYQHWHGLITSYPPPSCLFTGTESSPPGYIRKPLTTEDEATQATILEERAVLLECFGQNTICKDLHRRASLCSIEGDFEYRIARIQASTLPNGFDHAIKEHFDRHMHRFVLRTLRRKKMKLFCPSNVWWTVTSLMKHPLRTKL